jgi:hypothetical protein
MSLAGSVLQGYIAKELENVTNALARGMWSDSL